MVCIKVVEGLKGVYIYTYMDFKGCCVWGIFPQDWSIKWKRTWNMKP